MGSIPTDPMRGFGELAAAPRSVSAFCIDIYEFPNERGKMPMANVTWVRAKRACEQRGKRLCTEAEWEWACKGGSAAAFPYGNRYESGMCNLSEETGELKKPVEAGAFGRCRSAFGTVDMAGNVAEWTSSQWTRDIQDKVVKGGSADQGPFTGRCASRGNEAAGNKWPRLGFRCCADIRLP